MIARYALCLQATLTCLAVVPAVGARSAVILVLTVVVAVAGFALLRVALMCTTDERLLWSAGALHLIVTLMLPLAFLLGYAPRWFNVVLLVIAIAPFTINGWLRHALRWGWWRNQGLLSLGAEGEPQYTPNVPAHVVVIGAGMSGLAAAWALSRKGVRVTVFDRDMRVGGRVLTADVDDTPVDSARAF